MDQAPSRQETETRMKGTKTTGPAGPRPPAAAKLGLRAGGDGRVGQPGYWRQGTWGSQSVVPGDRTSLDHGDRGGNSTRSRVSGLFQGRANLRACRLCLEGKRKDGLRPLRSFHSHSSGQHWWGLRPWPPPPGVRVMVLRETGARGRHILRILIENISCLREFAKPSIHIQTHCDFPTARIW